MIGKPSSPVRREAARKRTSPGWHLAVIEHPPIVVFLASLLAAGFIVYRHKSNLERLRAGTENPFRWGGPVEGHARAARHVR